MMPPLCIGEEIVSGDMQKFFNWNQYFESGVVGGFLEKKFAKVNFV